MNDDEKTGGPAFYMTVWDRYAAAALRGMSLPGDYSSGPGNDSAVSRACAVADAMIAERAKRFPPKEPKS